MNRNAYRTLGILFWAGLACVGFVVMRKSARDAGSQSPQTALVHYFTGPAATVEAIDRTGQLHVYDPVFFQADDGHWLQIGYVESTTADSTSATPSGTTIRISWNRADVLPNECDLIHYRNSGRLEDIVATMLPAEKRLLIQQRLAAAISEHGQELSASFAPLVQASLQRSLPVIQEEFQLAVERHRDQIDVLVGRWNDELVNERLIPLARREIVPIVRKHGEPTANKIGRELWDRASLWRFAWRAVYDKSPLPKQGLVQEEWDRFVDQEAIPVFESHMDDVVASVQNTVIDVAANEAVRQELGAVASDLAADPKARELVRSILKETLIDNPRLRQVWSTVWTTDEAQRALNLAGDRLEPIVRQIGDDLFGSQAEGITPGFARVLRNQILGKDRQWLVARRSSGQPPVDSASPVIRIQLAADSMSYPIVHLADSE